MANKYVTANNKLVVVDGKLLQVSGDNVDDELINLIDTQTTSLGTTELSVSELDTLIDNHIVDGVTLDSSALLIDSPSNNSVEIKDIRVSNIDVAFITVNTTNGYIDLYGSGNDVTLYQDTTLTYESGNITTDNLVAENIKKDVNILGVVGTHEGGGSLNVAYSLTPPTDTSKIWLQCAEPIGVEVQNYLGECAVSNVANYGGIDNPVINSSFHDIYFSPCYIGNNQIAIVGANHIRIYDLTTKSYIADYTVSINSSLTNVLFKDNVLYFGHSKYLYSFDLSTQTLNKINSSSTLNPLAYIYFVGDTKIEILGFYNTTNNSWYFYSCDLSTGIITQVSNGGNGIFKGDGVTDSNVKAGDYLYNFNYHTSNYFKINLKTRKVSAFTSWKNFVTSLGSSSFYCATAIYDNDRYIYIIGGGNSSIGYNNIIKYDTVNDTFEMLEQKLLSGKYKHYSVLVDNRVYIFGGEKSGSTYGNPNNLDYFDLQFPLNQNNAILTINNKTDKYLPLINTEKLKINSNIASAYLGNANNLAEKVNAYYWNGYGWVGINCTDYDTYFVWSTITNETINSALVIDLSTYYTTNSKDVALSVSSTNATAFEVTLSGTELTVKPLEVSQTTTITVTATVNAVEYQTTFTVTSADIITSA